MMININKKIPCLFTVILLVIIFSFPGNGGIVFSDLDLSPDNQLLFIAGSGSAAVQDALFLTRIPAAASGSLAASGNAGQFPVQQLTVFPEKMDLLEDGHTIQIRNAFGAMRVPVSGGLPMPIPGLPSFAGGSRTVSGRAGEMISSPDGRWLLYLDPVTHATARLFMIDVYSGTQTHVTSVLDRPETVFPASWSPDSRFFIYEREGNLYYYMAGSPSTATNERIRLIGEGTVKSVSWGIGGDFFYLRGSTLYQVRSAELFARTIYADFLEIGVVAGKIPFEFDPCFDAFWIAPDARSLLVSKGRRSLFYFPLTREAINTTNETVLPYLLLPGSCSSVEVLWPQAGPVTILVSIPNQAGVRVNTWRLHISGDLAGSIEGSRAVFEALPAPSGLGPGFFPNGSLSPDGRLALFWGDGGILLYDYANWRLLEILGSRSGITCLWAGNDLLVTGDDAKIERIQLVRGAGTGRLAQTARRDLVCLSRTVQAAFEEGSFRILARSGSDWYVTDGRSSWVEIRNPRMRSPVQASGDYRVFLERQRDGFYENLPMIRNISSVGTFSLFPPDTNSAGSPSIGLLVNENPFISGSVFSRGQGTGPREIALCFDLYDDDRGLPEVLDALSRRGIKATFFINGEFIRRHPQAVSLISAAGHEIGSMFFALIDFSDSRFLRGDDFISRGLARNEDEYFRLTGKELSLLWHPPWYIISAGIAASAAAAGYTTIGRDIDPFDWVSLEDEKRLGLPGISPSRMIDSIMEEVRPGSVIPVRLGLLSGGRNDYLFNRINVLLDALSREGYALVTVSALLEHAR